MDSGESVFQGTRKTRQSLTGHPVHPSHPVGTDLLVVVYEDESAAGEVPDVVGEVEQTREVERRVGLLRKDRKIYC